MYQQLTDWETHAENMQISVSFCKTRISLKNLENIHISVNMINRLDITDEYSVKCDLILNTVTFIDAALNISLRKLLKCYVYDFIYLAKGFRMRPKVRSTLRGKWTCKHLEMRLFVVSWSVYVIFILAYFILGYWDIWDFNQGI